MSKTPENWHPAPFHIIEFFECIENNNKERLDELLNLFPNDIINIKDGDGNTPLHMAAKNGNLELVKLFVNNGADLYAINNQGNTAVQEALNNQRTTVGAMLGYADTGPVQDYLIQMDASLNKFIEIAQGVSPDKSQRLGAMLKKAPWMLNSKTEDGEIVKNIVQEAKQTRKNSKEIADLIQENEELKNGALELKQVDINKVVTRLKETKEKAIKKAEARTKKAKNDNITAVIDSLKNKKSIQKEVEPIGKFLKLNPEFRTIIDEASGIENKKSRMSAKIARFLLGRKTDKDLLKEAIAQLKDAVSSGDKSFEVKKIDRWESWKKNNNHQRS